MRHRKCFQTNDKIQDHGIVQIWHSRFTSQRHKKLMMLSFEWIDFTLTLKIWWDIDKKDQRFYIF